MIKNVLLLVSLLTTLFVVEVRGAANFGLSEPGLFIYGQYDPPVNLTTAIYQSAGFAISPAFPNPSAHTAQFNYQMEPDQKARVVLRNALGSTVKIYILNPAHDKLQVDLLDLKPGMYFYSILHNGQAVTSRTLIVGS